MKTIISETKNAACKEVAYNIIELINEKHNACIAFSAADIPIELFNELTECFKKALVDFSGVKIFSVGEYVSGDKLCSLLMDKFLSKVNVSPENCFFLSENNYADYDGKIASCGGLDLVILGLGKNCQIGFNEPGTPFSSLTHIQKLPDSIVDYFPEKPKKAMTLGIKSITDAKKIIVMAFGEEKSEALFRMLYARNDPATPAAFLQIPSDVYVYADSAAAAQL